VRWNGIRWRRVPTPTFKSGGQLAGVTAVSPRRAWAVGTGPADDPLILEWNGHRWTDGQLPALPSCDAYCGLTGVAATSAGNAWAVGSGPADNPLILHWNGKRWTDAQLPALPSCSGNCPLTSVAATSSSNAWAVGVNLDISEVESTSTPFILHWNGRTWKNMPCPLCKASFGGLSGLNAVTAWRGLAWAVGYAQPLSPTGPAGPGHVVIVKWNGHVWRQTRVSGGQTDTDPVLNGVAAASGKLAWAVGGPQGGPTAGVSSALLFTWNGKVWR
jgi:hypothetical protein